MNPAGTAVSPGPDLTRPAAISFDVTGTLLGVPRLGEIYAESFARHGLAAPPGALAAMVREVWRELSVRIRLGECRFTSHPEGAKGFWRDLVFRVAARLELPPPTPFLAAELYERFAHAEAWEVFPEVPEALAALRAAGVRLAVTSNFDPRLPRLLADTGLAASLEVVVFSAEVGVEKPHPAIFEELLGALELPASEVLHVGDSRRDDVEGALAVGMRALWLTRGSRRGDLASLGDLPARLLAAPPPDRAAGSRHW
jgi:putative hydrolase of the HAD superfamily